MAITVGTDCSGIDAPIFAFRRLGVKIDHVFSCDSDRFAKESIMANCRPRAFLHNIFRNHTRAIHTDFYFLGFPCQSFSMAGKRRGFDDARGDVFFEGVKHIKSAMPKVFVLENVSAIVHHDGGATFGRVLKSLEGIGGYAVSWGVLNSKDFGVPQNRPRVFIVGILKSAQRRELRFPRGSRGGCTRLEDLLENVNERSILSPGETQSLEHVRRAQRAKGYDIDRHNFVIDVGASTSFASCGKDVCPCLKANRCNYYLSKYRRKLTPRECLRLQGFPDSFRIVVSNSQMYRQAGNSITVNVLAALIRSILRVL